VKLSGKGKRARAMARRVVKNFVIDVDQADGINKLARAEDCSRSSLVREALAAFLNAKAGN
jgi:predicted transcriptional regulator